MSKERLRSLATWNRWPRSRNPELELLSSPSGVNVGDELAARPLREDASDAGMGPGGGVLKNPDCIFDQSQHAPVARRQRGGHGCVNPLADAPLS